MRLLISSQILNVMVKLAKEQQSSKNEVQNLSSIINLSYKYDSLRIYIPLEKVDILDDYFGSLCVITNTQTGVTQMDKEAVLQKEYRDHIHPNIRTTFKIDKKISFNAVEESYRIGHLVVFVNAKQLQNNYLQGITKDTIKDVYNYIISLGAVRFSYEDFINARILDIDVCRDFICPSDVDHNIDRDKLFSSLKSGVDESKGAIVNKYKQTTLYYNQDRERATIGKPHIKLYDKTAELRGYKETDKGVQQVSNNLGSFYLDYLEGTQVDRIIHKGIIRLEYTLRNAKGLDHFGLIKVRTLKDLINIDSSTLDAACKKMFSKYYKDIPMPKETNREELKDLTPDSLILVDSIEFIMSVRSDYNTEDILKLLTNKIRQYKSKSMLSKKRAEIKELINDYIAKDVKDDIVLNNDRDARKIDILKSIGLYD